VRGMNQRVLTILAPTALLTILACGPSTPASAPAPAPASAPASASASASASAPASAPASASASASAAAPASASPPVAEVMTTPVTAVASEVTPPAVVSPDKVIATLRPKFNACFADGLKKDPKTSGSVTLSAKIEKDGKVSAVTPKMLTGFTPAVVKCLSDHLKTANFAAAGGINYTTSLDIPLTFTSNQ
jgi:hypothetical protein